MSWVIAKCIFKSGNNNLRDYIGKYNKFSSKKSHIRKALAHEALQSRKHNQNITELIKKMDLYQLILLDIGKLNLNKLNQKFLLEKEDIMIMNP